MDGELEKAPDAGAILPALPPGLEEGSKGRTGNWCRSFAASNRALVLTALVLTFLGYRCGEKIAVNDGYGWDGLLYGQLAADFYSRVVTIGLDAYHAQRILPSALVHYGLRFLRIPRSTPNIICVFGLLNVALLTLAAWCWCRVADSQQISWRGKWLGFVGLFINFALLKWSSYYAVLTDSYAFVIGLLILHCYLTRQRWGVITFTFLGAFVWPTLICHGLPLVMFPRGRTLEPAPGPAPWHLNKCLAAAPALGACALLFRLLLKGHHHSQLTVLGQSSGALGYQPLNLVTGVALVGVFLYLGLGVAMLWNWSAFDQPRYLLASIRPLPVLTGMGLFLGSKAVVAWLARFPTALRFKDALVLIGWSSIQKPALFEIAHVVYFGPVILLAVLRWRRVCEALHPYGLGLTLCVSFNLLLSLDCESRHLIHFFPILVFAVIKAMEDVRWRMSQFGLFVLLSLVFSKCWLTIGGMRNAARLEEFPAQLLFMNFGPWMSWEMYYLQGSAVLVAGGIVLALLVSRRAGGWPQGPERQVTRQ